MNVTGNLSPSFEQLRFMCRVAGERPHFDRVKGLWRCVGRGFYGYGETWRAAFNAWVIQRVHDPLRLRSAPVMHQRSKLVQEFHDAGISWF